MGDTSGRHPSTTGLLRWFDHGHLPDHLAAVSAPFGELADRLVDELPDSPELTVALRKLLEGKDAAVRAAIDAGPRMTRGPGPVGAVGGVPLAESAAAWGVELTAEQVQGQAPRGMPR